MSGHLDGTIRVVIICTACGSDRLVDVPWTSVDAISAHVAPLSLLTPVEFEARHQPTTAA